MGFFLSYLENDICQITYDVENENEQKQSSSCRNKLSIKGMESTHLIYAG